MFAGITCLLETHETQLVASYENNIMFYDFIDKVEKERIEKS